MTNKRFTSRSANNCYKACPRKRYFNYHIFNTGIHSRYLPLETIIGTYCHKGLEILLTDYIGLDSFIPKPETLDLAIKSAIDLFSEDLLRGELPIKGAEGLDFVINETKSLVEGLIYSFYIYRLPRFLEQYEILEIEEEEAWNDFSKSVIFLGKPDGVLRDRRTNELVILSFKTITKFEAVTIRNITHDSQGMSECIMVQLKIDKLYDRVKSYPNEKFPHSPILRYLATQSSKPKVNNVQYEHLIKGKYSETKRGEGFYSRQSFLIHPYKEQSDFNFNIMNFEIGEYKWKAKGKLPDKFKKINIWEDIGVRDWIDKLIKGEVQPEEGQPLEEICLSPEIIKRSDGEIERWYNQVSYMEETIANNLDYLNVNSHLSDIEKARLLDYFFPMNEASCHDFYGSDCTYLKLCHERGVPELMLESGYYIKRFPHHVPEEMAFKEKGWIK